MPDNSKDPIPGDWGQAASRAFLDYGRYFVPDRETQFQILVNLVQGNKPIRSILELCCGDGRLAELLLEQYPNSTVWGYDGSPEILARAEERLKRFENRFQFSQFDLADHKWRKSVKPVQAVVSSLALHHLEDPGKQRLFQDVYTMLLPGGVFLIADIIAPTTQKGWQLAAEDYDEAVRQRALKLDGNESGFEFFKQKQWNLFRYFDPDDIDYPSSLFDQLKWLEEVGFTQADAFWMRAGHAVFGGWKPG